MAYTQITYDTDGDVGVLTLNRPAKLNAWTHTMSEELIEAISAANADPAIGALVMTGAGRGFCAGADVSAVFQARADGDESSVKPRGNWVQTVRTCKPIVAAVNGATYGIGLTMILPFDNIVASSEAKLSCAFIKMGIVPELGSSTFLVRRAGWGVASDLMLSGRAVDADEALRIGLVDVVVEPDALLDAAKARARTYGANSDTALRYVKELLTLNAVETDISLVQQREGELLAKAFESPEHKEAITAFQEKRAPKFR